MKKKKMIKIIKIILNFLKIKKRSQLCMNILLKIKTKKWTEKIINK